MIVVLFDVNLSTGEIKGGMSNAHWYRLGLKEIFSCPWLPPDVIVRCQNGEDNHNDEGYSNRLGKKTTLTIILLFLVDLIVLIILLIVQKNKILKQVMQYLILIYQM